MKLTLKIWRQKNAKNKGKIVEYPIDGISPVGCSQPKVNYSR